MSIPHRFRKREILSHIFDKFCLILTFSPLKSSSENATYNGEVQEFGGVFEDLTTEFENRFSVKGNKLSLPFSENGIFFLVVCSNISAPVSMLNLMTR